MLELFTKEYQSMKVFEEQSYKHSLDYGLMNAKIDQLNFCYILDRQTFQYFARQIGFSDHDMMEEDNAELSAAGPVQLKNDVLVDFTNTSKLGHRTQIADYTFLNYVLKSESEESDLVYINQKVFKLIQKTHNSVLNLKRVLYKTADGMKVERHLPIVSVLCIDNLDVKDKKINAKNIKNYIRTVQISKYMNESDFVLILKEMASKVFGAQLPKVNDYQILIPEEDDLDDDSIEKIFNGKANVTAVAANDNMSKYEIFSGKLVIFYHKANGTSWHINYETNGGSSAPMVPTLPSRMCRTCHQIIDRDERMRRICVCGRVYCDYTCKQKDNDHKCECQPCSYCRKTLGFGIEMCDCGKLYCDSDCKDSDFRDHSKTCNYSKSSKTPSYSLYGSYYRRESMDEDLMESENLGRVGFSNIGNTCYMNSALQAAMHTDLLKAFFLKYDYTGEINENNVFGTKGALLKEIGDLYKTYYHTKSTKITPYRFKSLVAKFNSTFEGYSQHDSQEFWSYFVDSIHEDTNRILTKPYVENLSAKLIDNDLEMARKSWINHLKRNYSLITENFTGQFKSTVECPQCQLTSITFDPYNLIPLSIPIINQHEFDFYFVNKDQTAKAIKYSFLSKSMHGFNDIPLTTVIEKFSHVLKIPAERLRFGIFGFSVIGDACKPHDTVGKFAESKVAYTNKPKIFLTELNEHDLACIQKPNPLLVLFKTDWEVYDTEHKINKYSAEYYRISREFSEDPIFTKMFYLTTDSTVRDLYISVLRKLWVASSFYDSKQDNQVLDQEFFRQSWDLIEKRLKDKRFFYIKQGDKLLSNTVLDKKISEACDFSDGKLVIRVFVRSKSNTTVEVDLERFVSCATAPNTKQNEVLCSSPDLENYKNEYNLSYLLDKFSQTETLDADNTWYCSTCKEHVQARKTIQIYKLPNYLVLHLKKLKYQAKHVPMINFPVDELNMEPYVMNKTNTRAYNITPTEIASEKDLEVYKKNQREFLIPENGTVGSSLKYKLYGVVNHYGSQNFGHYTAYAQLDSGQWAEFNDSSTSLVTKDQVVSDGAYILFYKRI
jgi:ubiquitin C-terminal hydrolase